MPTFPETGRQAQALPDEDTMKVKDAMIRHPGPIQASATLAEAVDEMQRRNARSLPVAEGDRLVGIITQRDLVFAAEGSDSPEDAPRVADAVRSEVAIASEDDDLDKTLAMMTPGGIRRMLVIDAAGKVTGILSITQLGHADGQEPAEEEDELGAEQ